MSAPMTTIVSKPGDLLEIVGTALGESGEHRISQEQINAFADVTGDHQWIHVDVDRAAQGPFGSTIVHGFFTLALVPLMLADILVVEETSMGVNYGLDKVRFVSPVKPDEVIRARATLLSASALRGGDGVQASARVTVERTADDSVCCVADIVFRYYN
ncbi:MaoC family dehydratase [Nocardioides alcanivorans]|uniref:MaoC family dehydratase n=1 Tax=Nocardioides alcanivorans TaxID=2897352 RepID=UPI001F44B10B|nr:MaoC family dehydratase [Nocardioides alcanivorans]